MVRKDIHKIYKSITGYEPQKNGRYTKEYLKWLELIGEKYFKLISEENNSKSRSDEN